MSLQYLQRFLGKRKVFNARTRFLLSFYGTLLLISSCTALPTSTQKPLEASSKPSQSVKKEVSRSQIKTPVAANSCSTIISDPDGWVNVRSSPTIQADNILRTLSNGTILVVVSETDGWLRVTEPVEGWIASNRTTQECEPAKENSAEAFYNQGIAKAQRGDDLGAINAFTQAIQLNPTFAEAYSNRGALQLENRKTKEAQSDFDQAIHLKLLTTIVVC